MNHRHGALGLEQWRAQLAQVKRALAAQDAQLAAAHAAMNPRELATVAPEARARFEAACDVDERRVRPGAPCAARGVRC